MSSIVFGGGFPDKTHLEILTLIRDKITSNWTETNPPLGDIRFNFDWNDDSAEFVVSIIHNMTTNELLALGNRVYANDMFAEIHIFVKQLTEDHPIKAGNIEKEIMRILLVNLGNLGNGISYNIPITFLRIDEPDNTSVYWHSMTTLQLSFIKFII